jgi:hypothetical protein
MQKIPSLANEPHATRKSNANMVADQESSCFSSLTYSQSGGGVFAEFTDGSSYFYPMSRSEAVEWFSDDSLGEYFNYEVREPTPKGGAK